MELHNRLANEAANYGGGNYGPGNYGGGNYGGGGVPQVASASIGLGPYGGFQSGQISPVSFFFLMSFRTKNGNTKIVRLICFILHTIRFQSSFQYSLYYRRSLHHRLLLA